MSANKMAKFVPKIAPRMKPEVQLRDLEADDRRFFENQRDPVAVAMVAYDSREQAVVDMHWAKIMIDAMSLKKTIVVDGQVAWRFARFSGAFCAAARCR